MLEHDIDQGELVPNERVDLEFKEMQPWRRLQNEKGSFKLGAEFESLSLGLDKQSQAKLIAEVTDQ